MTTFEKLRKQIETIIAQRDAAIARAEKAEAERDEARRLACKALCCTGSMSSREWAVRQFGQAEADRLFPPTKDET